MRMGSQPAATSDEVPSSPSGTPAMQVDPEQEVVSLCRDLLRIDSSNPGDGTGPGEREAGEYVMARLTEVGLSPEYLESAPRRGNVVVRTAGADPTRPALVVHGHLDVVPAQAEDWQVPPFAGEERDGCLWGRGAVDMKDMDAMMLAVLRQLARSGQRPPRDIIWAFFADEEAGGQHGAHWMVQQRPDLFEGASEAISEVGGFCVTVPTPTGPRRAYLLQTAEKGMAWLRLRAHGRAGHGSVPNDENAVTRLAAAVTRIAEHRWPRQYIASVAGLLDGLAELTGTGYTAQDCAELLQAVPGVRGFIDGSLRDTATPTVLSAGYKTNVIPQTADATLDCRFLPGHGQELLDTIRRLAGEHVQVMTDQFSEALESPADTDLVTAMTDALRTEEPDATVLPYCLSGGTDNKALALLGIVGYGFVPLRLPAELPFAAMFHGIDERVPIDSLRFGTRVLGRLIGTC